MTLGDLLLENRIIFLQGEIHDGNANELVMKLLYLQSENRRKDIHFYINSPGGSVSATLAIYDTMQIICLPGGHLLRRPGRQRRRGAAGRRRKGQALRPAECQSHDPSAVRPRRRPSFGHRNPGRRNPQDARALNEILASHTGQPSNESPKHRSRLLHERR